MGMTEVLFGVMVKGPQPGVVLTENCGVGGPMTQISLYTESSPQPFPTIICTLYKPGVVKDTLSGLEPGIQLVGS